MRAKTLITIGLLLVAASIILAACGADTSPTPPPPDLDPLRTPAPQQTQAECPEVVCPEPAEVVGVDVPFQDLWAASPHADAEAEAFAHWDEADPQEIPVSCAKCHSSEGFIDFVGADGSEFGVVNQAPPRGSIIACAACHNEQTQQMDSVTFPSGVEITGLGSEAVCMQCHQGRASTVQVEAAIEKAGATGEEDTPNADLGFVNVHYFAAAATQYGSLVQGGYQYEGQAYDQRFEHVEGYNTCESCHNSHTLELKLDECAVCHQGVAGREDVLNIRMEGSLADYDGDGNVTEGLAFEVEGLQEKLYQAIQAYGAEVAGTPIIYDSSAHPYFFIDTNENGESDEGEAVRDNMFNAWTPRLLKAAYNYQVSLKDPGAFAHGGKYLIQVLHDSIADLNSVLSTPVDMAGAHRDDPGHFDATAEAFRHWDAEGLVPAGCAKCHSGEGLPVFLGEASRASDRATGVNIAASPTTGLECSTCHDDVTTFTRFQVDQAKFPSNALISFGEGNDNNLCLQCHQGREANRTVQEAIRRANVEADAVGEGLSFRNPHYFAAGATLFGSEAEGAFQYPDKEYAGRSMHVEPMSTCVQCHNTHALEVNVLACSGCHQGANTLEALRDIRFGPEVDYDGDEQVQGLGHEIESMHAMLLDAIMAYAGDNPDTVDIVYSSASHPYWFIDQNGNGVADPDEVNRANAYNTWTPRLLGAAYNYQWVAKDPGAFAHNGVYILQVLYDSLEDLGADVSGMVRAEAAAQE